MNYDTEVFITIFL